MKKILFILFAVCLFTACSDDDKDDDRIKPTTENIIGSWADLSRTSVNYFQFLDDENGYFGNFNNNSWDLKEKFTYTLSGYVFEYKYKNTLGGSKGEMYLKDGFLYIGGNKYERVQPNNSGN